MATVNKNFVIKNGLVVQGSTATINGNDILTKDAGDSYILSLVGGAALVKSVDSVFDVDGSGNLTLNYGTGLTKSGSNLVIDRSASDTWYDEAGAASSAQSAAQSYADGLASNYDPAGAASSAQSAAQSYADTAASNAQSAAQSYADGLA